MQVSALWLDVPAWRFHPAAAASFNQTNGTQTCLIYDSELLFFNDFSAEDDSHVLSGCPACSQTSAQPPPVSIFAFSVLKQTPAGLWRLSWPWRSSGRPVNFLACPAADKHSASVYIRVRRRVLIRRFGALAPPSRTCTAKVESPFPRAAFCFCTFGGSVCVRV